MPITVDFSDLPSLINRKYYPLLFDQHRYLVLWGGGSSGKSFFAAQKIIYRMLTEQPHRFLVLRKVGKTLRDSTFAELKNTIRCWGLEKLFIVPKGTGSDIYMRCINGNEIIFAGFDDPEKIKSIQGITGIWIEEASEFTPGDFRQLDIRLRGYTQYYKQLILSFNPVSVTHWLKTEFFDQGKENCLSLHSTYQDNRFLDQQSIDVLEGFAKTDEYYYTVYCLGEWGVFGTTVYNAQIVTERLMAVRGTIPARGGFTFDYEDQMIVDKSIEFLQDDQGFLSIYEQPKPYTPYVIGGDIADGGFEFSAASVRNNITWNQAAMWHGHIDPDLYAKQMYCLGKYYNKALIGIEVNFDIHPVKELERLGYYHMYRREHVDKFTREKEQKHGFITTKLTRPLIISKHVALVREHSDTFNSARELDEMLTFVRDESGRPGHQAGKTDDTIFADAICLEVREQERMIEAKRPEKDLTEIQKHKRKMLERAGVSKRGKAKLS
jgi:phage terminase large subunit